jgi:hypothetical protein
LQTSDTEIKDIPDGWEWFNKKNAEYQFGKKGVFSQTGKVRAPIFVALMDLFMESPKGMSIKTIAERTGTEKARVRIEIDGINDRLVKIGLCFRSPGDGYYRIVGLALT